MSLRRAFLSSARAVGTVERTAFHAGGVAANAAANASIVAKNDSKIELEEVRTVPFDEDGTECEMVVSRLGELRFVDVNTKIVLSTVNV